MGFLERVFKLGERGSTPGRDVHWAFHVVSAVLVLRYVFVPP